MSKCRPKRSTQNVKKCPPPQPRPTMSQFNELNAQVQQLNGAVQTLTRQQAEVSAKLRGSSGPDYARLRKELQRVTGERKHLRKLVAEGRQKCDALEAQARKSSTELSNTIRYNQNITAHLLEELGHQKVCLEEQQKRIAALRRTQLHSPTVEVKAQLAQSEEELASLREGLKEIAADLKETQAVLRKVTAERNQTRVALEQMTKSRDMWQAVAAQAIGANVALNASNADLRKSLQAQREGTEKLKAELSNAAARSKALGCENVSLRQLNQELVADINAANRQRLQEQRSAIMAEEDLRLRLGEVQQVNKELTTFYEGVIARLKEGRNDLESESRDAKALAAANAAMLAQAQSERDQWREQAEHLDEAYRDVSVALQAEIDTLHQENVALKGEVDEKDAQISAITAEREMAEKELEEMKQIVVIVIGLAVVFGLACLLLDRNGSVVDMPSIDERSQKAVVENERWYPFPFSTWSKKLLPTDRARYTLIDGQTPCEPPEDFPLLAGERWAADAAWRVEPLGSPDGWLYALDFPATHYTENFPTACVRRRIHVREFEVVDIVPPISTKSAMVPGGRLQPGNRMQSPSGQFHCVLQDDGNLVLYNGAKALWSSKTCGKPPRELVFQTDGNVVLYGISGAALWSTGTLTNDAARFTVQDDGNLVVYNTAGKAIWAKK